MKSLFWISFFAVLAMLSFRSASSLEISDYSITFDIFPDGRTNETISMAFASPLNSSSLNYIVVGDISGLSISADGRGIEYTIEKTGSEQNVKFVVPEGTRGLSINFIARDLVFANENVYGFFTNVDPPEADAIAIKAVLPAGFAVYRNVVYPDGYQTLSDGERIFMLWNPASDSEMAISFKFYNTHNDYSLIIIAVMALGIVAVAAYLVTHYRKKVSKAFVRGFTEDERRALLILGKNKTCMQKKIEKELGFSRAKMTRIVKKLEAEGLVEKEQVGRTNRLHYKK